MISGGKIRVGFSEQVMLELKLEEGLGFYSVGTLTTQCPREKKEHVTICRGIQDRCFQRTTPDFGLWIFEDKHNGTKVGYFVFC